MTISHNARDCKVYNFLSRLFLIFFFFIFSQTTIAFLFHLHFFFICVFVFSFFFYFFFHIYFRDILCHHVFRCFLFSSIMNRLWSSAFFIRQVVWLSTFSFEILFLNLWKQVFSHLRLILFVWKEINYCCFEISSCNIC